ncbi:MAG: hypothetical protein R2862_13155 [Thermoanaerobaculia bacterium]
MEAAARFAAGEAASSSTSTESASALEVSPQRSAAASVRSSGSGWSRCRPAISARLHLAYERERLSILPPAAGRPRHRIAALERAPAQRSRPLSTGRQNRRDDRRGGWAPRDLLPGLHVMTLARRNSY